MKAGDDMCTESCLIRHCAPTLAGMKVGSLFSFSIDPGEDLESEEVSLNRRIEGKGLVLRLVRADEKRGICYLYRRKQLLALLDCRETAEFLRSCGYEELTEQAVLSVLLSRMTVRNAFPHEAGLFLGYPLADVRSFIENGGKDCLLSGLWKVYHDPEQAVRTFERYEKCTRVYCRLFGEGRSLKQLTVAA